MGNSLSSPNLEGADRFAFEPRRVDKPWGYELIWALTEDYCGKVLFVRAGESLEVTLCYDRRAALVDLGCEGPAGWRGWSGGARDRFAITPQSELQS